MQQGTAEFRAFIPSAAKEADSDGPRPPSWSRNSLGPGIAVSVAPLSPTPPHIAPPPCFCHVYSLLCGRRDHRARDRCDQPPCAMPEANTVTNGPPICRSSYLQSSLSSRSLTAHSLISFAHSPRGPQSTIPVGRVLTDLTAPSRYIAPSPTSRTAILRRIS